VESNTEGKVIKRFAPNVPPEACEPDIVAALNRP
jgi:glutathione peroxidase-family protein